jgi:hypothetical protein
VFIGRSTDVVRIAGDALVLGRTIINNTTITSSTGVCISGGGTLGSCSSSLRYKTDVQPFFGGLEVVQRLRPITFNWKDGGMHDVGFGAEEVNEIEPLLTFRNQRGEIEGVKYAQITTVLVNAVKEQQQIIEQQQRQTDALKQLICLSHPRADVCKRKMKN